MRARVWCLALAALLAGVSSQEHDLEEETLDFDEEAYWNRDRRDVREFDEEEEWVPPPRERRDLRYDRRSCCEYEQPVYRVRRSEPHYEVREDNGEEPQGTAPLFRPAEHELTGAASEHAAYGLHPDRHRIYGLHQQEHVRYAVRPKKHRSDVRQPFGAYSGPRQAFAAHPDNQQVHDNLDKPDALHNEEPLQTNEENGAHAAFVEGPPLHDKYYQQKPHDRYLGKPKAHPYIPEKELRALHTERRPETLHNEEHFHHNMEPGAPAAAHYLPHRVEPPAEEDQEPEGTNHHAKKSGHSQALGGGQAHRDQHHSLNNAYGSKGYKSAQHSDKGTKGFKTKDLRQKQYEEAEGKKKQHHDNAAHHGDHEEQAHGQKGAKFDEKKGHKKGHKTKGYHNKYHKDEFHKEHKFYDDYHKGGSHHRYGKFHAKHSSNEGGKKKAHHVDAAHDAAHKGTKGFSNKGHIDADHHGHRGKQGHEEHHAHQETHGKKGGGGGASKWAYKHN